MYLGEKKEHLFSYKLDHARTHVNCSIWGKKGFGPVNESGNMILTLSDVNTKQLPMHSSALQFPINAILWLNSPKPTIYISIP